MNWVYLICVVRGHCPGPWCSRCGYDVTLRNGKWRCPE